MLDLLIGGVCATLLLAVFVGYLLDAAWVALYITEPLVRGFQRIFLGIDKIKAGPETLIGKEAVIDRSFSRKPGEIRSEGIVRVDGELWRAQSTADEADLVEGQLAIISSRDGLTLTIEPQSRVSTSGS